MTGLAYANAVAMPFNLSKPKVPGTESGKSYTLSCVEKLFAAENDAEGLRFPLTFFDRSSGGYLNRSSLPKMINLFERRTARNRLTMSAYDYDPGSHEGKAIEEYNNSHPAMPAIPLVMTNVELVTLKDNLHPALDGPGRIAQAANSTTKDFRLFIKPIDNTNGTNNSVGMVTRIARGLNSAATISDNAVTVYKINPFQDNLTKYLGGVNATSRFVKFGVKLKVVNKTNSMLGSWHISIGSGLRPPSHAFFVGDMNTAKAAMNTPGTHTYNIKDDVSLWLAPDRELLSLAYPLTPILDVGAIQSRVTNDPSFFQSLFVYGDLYDPLNVDMQFQIEVETWFSTESMPPVRTALYELATPTLQLDAFALAQIPTNVVPQSKPNNLLGRPVGPAPICRKENVQVPNGNVVPSNGLNATVLAASLTKFLVDQKKQVAKGNKKGKGKGKA